MNEREKFEKWASESGFEIGIFQVTDDYRETDTDAAWDAWQARQPEIDAINGQLDTALRMHDVMRTEIATLKAEAEKLRKDAERYQFIRDKVQGRQDWQTLDLRFDFPIIRPIAYVLKGSVAQHLDDAIDAMKETK